MNALKRYGMIPLSSSVLEAEFETLRSVNDKLSDLERNDQLIRLKRGLYVVSPAVTGRPLSTELIANHLYGPSYVSMESALRHHGLIPESVYAIRSLTTKRSRVFENSIGRFEFIQCQEDYFSIGIQMHESDGYAYLMASPEKALCDFIAFTPALRFRSLKNLRSFLFDNLRIDVDGFNKLDAGIFQQCAAVGKKKMELMLLTKLLEK